jgi:hypothetical protein
MHHRKIRAEHDNAEYDGEKDRQNQRELDGGCAALRATKSGKPAGSRLGHAAIPAHNH